MVLGLRHFSERVGDGNGQPRVDAEAGEELVHVQPGVAIALGARPLESPGTLYITNKKVVWLSDVVGGNGYAVDFVSMALHAVSRDPEAYEFPCIYTQIETADDEDELTYSDEECAEVLDLGNVREMRLVPSDPSQLDTLFNVFCQCAELNPDPNAESDDENEWVFADDVVMGDGTGLQLDSQWHVSDEPAIPIGYTTANHDLVDTVLELKIDDERFEDAEENEPRTNGNHSR